MSVIPEPPAQTGEPVAPGAPGGEDQRPAPASPAPADLQDLLWQRISAAMIDLAVLLAPFLVLSVPFPARTWTISGYLDYWLSEVAAHRVRPSTLRTYSIYVQDHLIPGLGKRRLHRLTAQHVRAFLNERRESGLSPRTVHHLHAVLRNALEHAVREDLLTRNVARQVRISAGHREEIEPYSVDEARRFLAAVRGDRLYALYAVALSLGLRRGEAWACDGQMWTSPRASCTCAAPCNEWMAGSAGADQDSPVSADGPAGSGAIQDPKRASGPASC